MSEAVKVMVRCRPMNGKEKGRGCSSVVEVDDRNNQINLFKPNSQEEPKSFSYDFVFGVSSAQALVYEQSAFSLVDSVLDGYNGTIFAYGQTGCGKTHTMMGTTTEEGKGIIPRTFSQIMTITSNDTSKTHLIRCSFMEIYNEEIHDLLGKDIKARMELKESPEKGIHVKDLTMIQVDNIETMQKYMEIGFGNRATRATNMNNQSSRSHSIFTIFIESQETDETGDQKFKAGKLNLVDLAGSERASKTGVTGDGIKQATKINLSLSALGNVISALVDGKSHHIPYRDSKLTRLLQDSLGGNTKTIMIAAVSPADYNYDQTLSTLRYASRAKFIKNKPRINEDPKDAMLRQMSEEIKKLKMMLEGKMPIQMETGGNTQIQQRIVYQQVGGQNKENTLLEEELKNKEEMLKYEQEQKIKLNGKLSELQKMFQKKEAVSKENEVEMEKIRKLKQKLKLQKKKEQQYQLERAKRESELLNIEKNYKSLNEEVDEMRQRFTEIKKKYVANLAQLRDIQEEHEEQKQQLLDTIRYQEKEIKKFNAILSVLMNNDQLDVIVNNSEWNEEKRQWYVPNFIYRERIVSLPKLNRDMNEEREKKEIVFRNSKRERQSSYQRREEGFKMNQIVKNARETYDFVPGMAPPRSNGYANRTQLTPIKNDSIDKIRTVHTHTQFEERKRKTEKLEPIQYIQTKKNS